MTTTAQDAPRPEWVAAFAAAANAYSAESGAGRSDINDGEIAAGLASVIEMIAADIESYRYKIDHGKGDACPCVKCQANMWLEFAARVTRRDAEFREWEATQ